VNDELERTWNEVTWPNFKVLSRHLPGETEENHNLSQGSRSPGRDLNQGPLQYEAGVLNTRPRRSVCSLNNHPDDGGSKHMCNVGGLRAELFPIWKLAFVSWY
jgi:hypothetical protein